MKITISKDILEIKKPTIPFTNIPNPIGVARVTYKDGVEYVIPFFYVQDLFLNIKYNLKKKFVTFKYKNIKYFKI